MKELKMFPQITEETEENLLHLEDDDEEPSKSPPSTPAKHPSSSSSSNDSPPPSSPNDDAHPPCPLLTVTNPDSDRTDTTPVLQTANSLEEESATPPARVRMRSLSGGAYRLAPTTLPSAGRMRRQSGDDVLTRVSPSRRAAIFEHFRPRSKSDSKGKRPTFLSNLRNTFFSGSAQRKTSLEADPPLLDPLQPGGDYRQRSRSGSETRGGTMSKMIDLFRSRSNSLSNTDSKNKKQLNSLVPTNALLRRHSVDPDKRRRPYNTYRSLEGHQGDSYACHTEEDAVERIDYANMAEDKIIPTYLVSHPCYEIMPTSGKVIILSVELLVKNAFSALVSNEIKAAPLWDASYFDFVGMLTISDFINVLRHYYYSSPEDIKDIENQSISTWRRITRVEKPFVKVGATDSLFQATKLLIQEGVHRIPVFDEKRQSVLFVLTRKRVLHYLCNSLFENFEKTNVRTPSFFRKTIGELKIGTFEDIATVNINTKVIDALDLFVKRNVSSLPVVDKDNILHDIFEKFDVFQLAKEQTYHNLDMEIKEAISKADIRETAWICSLTETFGTVINRFVNNKVHRMVITDDDRGVVGILSLSDVLKFLVLNPMENSSFPSATETILETSEGAAGGSGAASSLESSQKAASFEEDSISEALSTLKIEEPKSE